MRQPKKLIAKELGEIEATLVMRFIKQEKKRKNDVESKSVKEKVVRVEKQVSDELNSYIEP